jgi:predicted PurR-regulated permease PerM
MPVSLTSRIVSFAVLLAFIVVIGALFYKVMVGFLVPIFLAAVLAVVFRPFHRMVRTKLGERDHLAAGATTALILLTVLLPLALVLGTAAIQGAVAIKHLNSNSMNVALAKVRQNRWFSLEMPYGEHIQTIQRDVEELQRVLPELDFSRLEDPSGIVAGLARRIGVELQGIEGMVGHQADLPGAAARFSAFHLALASLTPPFPPTLEARPDGKESLVEVDMLEIQSRGVALSTRWQELKQHLLGGPIKTFAKELANPSREQVSQMTSSLIESIRPRLLALTSTTGGFLVRMAVGIAILTVTLFFFLCDGRSMMESLMRLSPLKDDYEQTLLLEFERTSRAVVLATLLSAVTQGVLATLGYWAAGMPSLVLLFLLTTTCAMVPFVGPALVWVPVCLFLALVRQQVPVALALAAWGTLVVGSSDNVVKMAVLHGQRQLHPLLALLSVLGGVQTLGPIGILVGPMAVTMLQTLLQLLQRELHRMDLQEKKQAKQQVSSRSVSKLAQEMLRRMNQDSSSPPSNAADLGHRTVERNDPPEEDGIRPS